MSKLKIVESMSEETTALPPILKLMVIPLATLRMTVKVVVPTITPMMKRVNNLLMKQKHSVKHSPIKLSKSAKGAASLLTLPSKVLLMILWTKHIKKKPLKHSSLKGIKLCLNLSFLPLRRN